MKLIRPLLSAAFLLFAVMGMQAQSHQAATGSIQHQPNDPAQPQRVYCRSEATKADADYEKTVDRQALELQMQRYLNSPFRTHRNFAIQIHIVRRDDGTGGIPIEDVRGEFENFVAPYFDDINVEFTECAPPNYISSTAYYSLSGDAEGDQMSVDHNVPGVFNIYFVNDPSGACGWARFPWSLPADYIVIANSCATNQSTLVHEIGHYFGLYHTHETGVGDGAEGVTRNNADPCYNCGTAGDLLCDTEADPRLNRNDVTVSAFPACAYSASLTDACGDSYTPDETNIMSYSLKACRTVFSAQQYARMEVYIDGDRDYLQIGCPCERPEAKCKNITVNLNATGTATITAGQVDNGSTADCDLESMTVSPNSFDCGDVGPNVVTLTVTDDLGWVSTCLATVTIADVTNPVITNHAANMTVECDGNGNVAQFNAWKSNRGGANATDACGGSWSNNSSGLSDGCGATGSETVTFTFTDPSGNKATTTATFTIEDKTPPIVDCPENIHLPECVETASWVILASDVCGGVTVVSNPPSGSVFPKGSTTTVEVIVTDACGNTSSCEFIVERDPDLEVEIDPVATSSLNTCAIGTGAHIILGYGGGPTCVTLNATASGGHVGGGYTYSWAAPDAVPTEKFTNGNTANPTFCADFQTAHCVSYTFRVTATDIHGCEETSEITVHVVNLGVFGDGSPCATPENPKVVLCHSPSNPGGMEKTLCISPNAVGAHMGNSSPGHGNDCLGDCDAVCVSEVPSAKTSRISELVDEDGSTLYDISASPNPFSGKTVLEVVAKQDTEVQLAVFDLAGRKVTTLFEGHLDRGVPYYFDFTPGNLQAGIYIAKLLGTNGDTKTTTLVFIR